jgi:acyl-[acyl-carrier-protein]-phospholipid O-acyltransferase / long-chain-fatty-acid--[acyl-carrier-protein] ligase
MTNTGFKPLLKNGGFQAFLWTQFLGALNDNIYKIAVSMRAVHVAANSSASGFYLSLAGAVFVVPFLLFSGYSGHVADAVSKRKVLVGVKVFEIFAMAAGLATFFTTRMEWMLFVLFLMALHSAVFSPAKYGIIPEMLPGRDLSRANALLEMSTFVAIVAGTSIGTLLFTAWTGHLWRLGVAMLTIAVAGFSASLRIPRVPAAGRDQPFRWNPFAEVAAGTRHLRRDRALWLAVLGISYFWLLGSLFQMDLLLFGAETLHATDLQIGLMATCLGVGIGAGSLLAGRLSGDKVELGLVPLGSALMGVFSIALYFARGSYAGSMAMLSLLGLAAGLYIVPLNALLQQRAGDREKGRLIATNNFYNTVGMLFAAALLWGMHDRLHFGPDRIILIFGFVTLAATVYIATAVDDFLVRFVLWVLTHTFFRIRIVGAENVPARGAALLVSNHVSYVDGFLIGACVQRFIRFMVLKRYFEMPALRPFLRLMKTIPVDPSNRRGIVESIRAARTQLALGHAVCIFAEGALTLTGNMGPFKRGLEKIAEAGKGSASDVPVIPVHLDRVWGSIFSFERGKYFWKLPKRIPYPVTVSFGAPMPANTPAHEVRQAIQELSSQAVELRKTARDRLDRRAIRNSRRHWNRFAMADSTGRELTRGSALTGATLISHWLRRECAGEEMIGVMLPPSVAGALVNFGIALAGRVAVNINYTAGREAMESAVAQCGIRTIITSHAFLAKWGGPMACSEKMRVYRTAFVEDIFAGAIAKTRAFLAARFAPIALLSRGNLGPDSLATVIFSSGSTGEPKGVMVSHYNAIANIEAIAQVFRIASSDRVVGALPFFHSFGYTVTVWFPLVSGCGAVYHASPMDAKGVGGLVAKYRGTLLLSTPTFCSAYVRKCSREEFSTIRYVLVGAEKLRETVAETFREKFGIEPLEGYGCTEMSPVIAVNLPDGFKRGAVGHPIPGVAAKIVDPETFEPLPPNREGLLLVKGANRMIGYLAQPQRTAEVFRNGWYCTGDIATLDDEGFLRITDRLARFSKIAGEMVPHLKVEEAIAAAGAQSCVTSIADERRGERLVALYVHAEMEPGELWRRLAETDLPKLWLPKREDLHRVESIPQLGTGKVDLRAARSIANERTSSEPDHDVFASKESRGHTN